MTGTKRWPDEDMRRMQTDDRLSDEAAVDPLAGGQVAPGPAFRPPVMVPGPGSGRARGERDALARPDPASVPRTSWRSEIKGASSVNLIAGLWLVLSPFVVAYRAADPVSIQVTLGAAVAVLALLRATTSLWKSWMSWANAVFGLATVFVAVFLGETVMARWNGVVTGALVMVLAALSASATDSAKRLS